MKYLKLILLSAITLASVIITQSSHAFPEQQDIQKLLEERDMLWAVPNFPKGARIMRITKSLRLKGGATLYSMREERVFFTYEFRGNCFFTFLTTSQDPTLTNIPCPRFDDE